MQARKSLAPVSANTMNSRASLAPGRASIAPGKMGGMLKARNSSFGGRQSMAPGGRRSTLAAGGPTKQIEDPRNVRDKNFIRGSLQRLIEFLVENNYDRQISPKQLEAPTTKDFLHILTFLYNKIDPKFVLGPDVATDVPAMFKRLRYPFNISKSHLQAVGSPHAWPFLLAALVWLVELLQYERQCEQALQDDMMETNPDRIFFEFLAKAYNSFLAGEDDGPALEEELAASFEAKNAATQEELKRVSKANEKMDEEIIELSDSKLETLQEKRELLIKDLDKFKLLIANLEKHFQEVDKKTEELKKDANDKEAELRATEAERDKLSLIIAQQEHNNIDAGKLNSERQRIMEELKRAGQEKERIQALIYEAEIQLANKQAEVERRVSEYNELGHDLKLMPASAKFAGGESYEVPLPSRGNSIDQLVSLGGKTTLKHDLVALHASLGARVREAQEERLVHEEREREMTARLQEKRREVRLVEEECRSKEALLAKDKDMLDEELKNASSEVQAIEEQLANGTSAAKMRLNAAKKRVDELRAELSSAVATYSKRRQQTTDMLVSIAHAVANHKLAVQERLQELEKNAMSTQTQIATA